MLNIEGNLRLSPENRTHPFGCSAILTVDQEPNSDCEQFYDTLCLHSTRYALPTRQLPLPRKEAMALAIGTDLVLKLLLLEVRLVAVDILR